MTMMTDQKFKNELPGWRELRGMSLGQLAERYLDPGEISTTRELIGNALLSRIHEIEGCGRSAFTARDRILVLQAIWRIGQ